MHSLVVIDQISLHILCMRMACHWWIVICLSCTSVVSCTSLSTLSSWSHKCLIGFKSSEQAGMIVITFCARWFTTARAVWAFVLTCWRIKFCPIYWAKRCTWEVRISIIYHWAFKLPLILTICVLPVTYSCLPHAAPSIGSLLLDSTDSDGYIMNGDGFLINIVTQDEIY